MMPGPDGRPHDGTASARTLHVVLIEDMHDVREGMALLINGSTGFRCAHRYRTMEDALADIETVGADVILTDLGLPGMSGIEGIARLRERVPAIPIIALTVHDGDDKVFAALCAGASGYLLKNVPPARLLESVREVAAGGAPCHPRSPAASSSCSADTVRRPTPPTA